MNLLILITPIIFLLFFTHLPNYVTSSRCPSIARCDKPRPPGIRFPFRLKDSEQPVTCGFPGFEVSCDLGSKQTLLDLQGLGKVSIKYINYAAQELWVNDPNNCLPKKLLNFNISNTPFSGIYHQNFNFFNCSTINKIDKASLIHCLSGKNYFVYATLSTGIAFPPPTCVVIASMVKVPVQWPSSLRDYGTFSTSSELNKDLRLSWFMPECQPCELSGYMCKLETDFRLSTSSYQQSLDIVCSNKRTCKGTNKALSIFAALMVGCVTLFCLGYLSYAIFHNRDL